MSKPGVVDIPHSLGREEARRRIEKGAATIADRIPGGTAEVRSAWEGDRLTLAVTAMGQSVSGHIDVFDDRAHAEISLPFMLSLFADKIEEKLRKHGPKLLK